MSAQSDNNHDIREEEVDGETSHNRKRAPTERSTVELPPKAKNKSGHKAEVWQHFTQKEDNMAVCNCKYCGAEIECDTKKTGTSSMRNHILRCKLYKAFLESGSPNVLASDTSGAVTTMKYDKHLFRRSVNEMIVLSELPFSFVESEGFRRFCHNMLPLYTVRCRKTATTDIFNMFMEEKQKLKLLFGVDKRRVSLTTDIWVALTTSCSYMVVTCHWIDTNWEMQKMIISFKPVLDHKGETIAENLSKCLDEWGIERVFTITVDNAKGNDKTLELFINKLRMKSHYALVRDGEYLHMRCCAHILNLIVRDGLTSSKTSIAAIRNAVKYVRSSGPRLSSFQAKVLSGKVTRGSLTMDCVTRWNSTYLMLTAALKLRFGFEKMLAEDKLYNEYFMDKDEEGEKRIGPPTSSDWDSVQRFAKFLKIFFNCTLAFSVSKSVTSSNCYHEIVTIERNLISLSTNPDSVLSAEATEMRRKFEKYWDGLINMNPLIIISSVLDPRNKMQFVSLCFDKLYGKGSLESEHLKTSIKTAMRKLYEEYATRLSSTRSSTSGGIRSAEADSEQDISMMFDFSDDDGYERLDSLYTDMEDESANEEFSSELDIYLLEKVVSRVKNSLGLEFDILHWWKHNNVKYPLLSEVARDVLALQVSSVASESAFSTSGRILDPYRSCLSPFMLEALVCLQQWLRSTFQTEKLANLHQMIEELEFQDSLADRMTENEKQ